MKLEDEVCSLEPSKRLRELGVKQESYFFWWPSKSDHVQDHKPEGTVAWCSAFTVAELGEMFESYCFTRRVYSSARDENWLCKWQDTHGINEVDLYGKTEADARAKMLIYLLENKLIPLRADKEKV
jgi:hypothetical protein